MTQVVGRPPPLKKQKTYAMLICILRNLPVTHNPSL